MKAQKLQNVFTRIGFSSYKLNLDFKCITMLSTSNYVPSEAFLYLFTTEKPIKSFSGAREHLLKLLY